MEQRAFVYILTNSSHTVLYVGVTNNIAARVWTHLQKLDPDSFTARYNLCKLVYCEPYESIVDAIAREKQLKGGSRKNKIRLIEDLNPEWKDLTNTLT